MTTREGTPGAGTEIFMQRMRILQVKLREIGTYQPHIFKTEFLPQQYLDIGWGGKDTEDVALFGSEIRVKVLQDKPNYIFETAPDVFYTILAFDADHPEGVYLLWIRTNICGDVKFASGKDIVRWQQPQPQKGESFVRRVFFAVFSQVKETSHSAIISKNQISGRKNFNVEKCMSDYELKHIIGVNCATVKYDPSVDQTIADLRDIVGLDPSGKKILYEVHEGKRKDYQ